MNDIFIFFLVLYLLLNSVRLNYLTKKVNKMTATLEDVLAALTTVSTDLGALKTAIAAIPVSTPTDLQPALDAANAIDQGVKDLIASVPAKA